VNTITEESWTEVERARLANEIADEVRRDAEEESENVSEINCAAREVRSEYRADPKSFMRSPLGGKRFSPAAALRRKRSSSRSAMARIRKTHRY